MVTESADETRQVGAQFAIGLKGGEILALTGGLGSGKTTFIQGLAQGLGIKKRIISPTFIILRDYEGKGLKFWHLDLYRIEKNFGKEAKNLGITEIWGMAKNVVAVEWAEKIKKLLPKKTCWIKFKNLGGERRRIKISNF